MNYRQLQIELKRYQSKGYEITCALNAKEDVLTLELERLREADADKNKGGYKPSPNQ